MTISRLYEPQGRWRVWIDASPGPYLPEWVSYRIQIPRSGVGGFELVVPLDSPNSQPLRDDLFTALSYEVMDQFGEWSEPPQGRCIPVTRRIDYKAQTLTLTGGTYGWLLGKAIRWYDSLQENVDGKKVFVNATVGTILAWHFNAAMDRYALQNLTIDFDGTYDSNGKVWLTTADVEYERGTPLKDIFDGFASLGILWRTSGSTIQVVQGEFADTPTDVPVMWSGIDVELDAFEVSLDSAAGAVLAVGQNEVGYAMEPYVGPYGRWQVSASQSGTSTNSTLTTLATLDLQSRGPSRSGSTVTLLPSSDFLPFDTIKPGQVVSVRTTGEVDNVFYWDLSNWDEDVWGDSISVTVNTTREVNPALQWDVSKWDETLWGLYVTKTHYVTTDHVFQTFRWDTSFWDEDVWGVGGYWWEEVTDQIDEIVVADDGAHATVSFTVGTMTMDSRELLSRTVRSVTGGRVVRRSLTGVGR